MSTPAVVGLGTTPWSPQQYDDGVPVGPAPAPPAQLEWCADTLLVRGPMPREVLWPPRHTVQVRGRTMHISVLWSTTRSDIQVGGNPTPPPYLEIRMAPVSQGPWEVQATHYDSLGVQLTRWNIGRTGM
jgi:hypothetical protein